MGNGFDLKEGKCTLGVRKKYFSVRVVKYYNRLSREAADVPPLEECKGTLSNGALSNGV